MIGIVGTVRGDSGFGINQAYVKYFSMFDTVVVLGQIKKHWVDEVIAKMDLIVLPGGADVNPARYNEPPEFETGKPDLQYEYFDTAILPILVENKMPIFGICRGLQTLNTFFGGTLIQDISPSHGYSTKSRYELVHQVSGTVKGTGKKAGFKVNSMHHQAIDRLGDGLTSILRAEDDTIEAVAHTTLPIVAVQWHPEEIMDSFSTSRISKLLGYPSGEKNEEH